ncbi:sulfatase-like hydrolase/transferase [Halosquirtibacter xylanolyticus]|uniref:sulfatase-like hydrolase/transferase n=1 Tax=Halosquirtibacter xylanolyticus TaxID=3374599 RepID=UPI003748BC9E|nr:sulfatase-like hydrolase/transferase [Prolixibacteraceae bacterium]
MDLFNNVQRKLLLGMASVGILAPTTVVASERDDSKTNFVVIMCDDVSFDMFGCYGNAKTHTPNIDKLASEGVVFSTAWNSAICSPARAEILTGCYGTTTGSYYNAFAIPEGNNRKNTNKIFHNHPTFSKILQDQGYKTAVAGKWHIGGAEHQDEACAGFDTYCMWEGVQTYKEITNKTWSGGTETPAMVTNSKSVKSARYWHPCIIQDHKEVETNSTDFGPDIFCKFICDFIDTSSKSSSPFLAYYPMTLPHGPYVETPLRTKSGSNHPNKGSKMPNDQRFEEMIDYIDILVGRIYETLERNNQIDNTVIIFTADNGTAVTAKSRGVERAVHVPYIVCGKGIKKRGMTHEICDATDILPTIIGLSENDYPKNFSCDGVDMTPFLTGQSDTHKDVIMACSASTQMLRTRDHLLEVVDPILGVPNGRYYYCGQHNNGKGYERAEDRKGSQKTLQMFKDLLQNKYVGLKKNHPYLKTKRGDRFMRQYVKPKSVKKHLYNHRDYQFYDESIVFEESTKWTPTTVVN